MGYADDLQTQILIMQGVARSLDERGYAMIMTRQNRNGANPKFLYSALGAGLREYLKDTGGIRKHRPVIIYVGLQRAYREVESPGDMLNDSDMGFMIQMPVTKRYAALVSALELMSEVRQGRRARNYTGNGVFRATRMASYTEFRGDGRTALEVLVRTLEMPQHRRLLLSREARLKVVA